MDTDALARAVATQLLDGLLALKKGDFSVRMSSHLVGIDGKIADGFNEVGELSQRMADELKRIRSVVGKEGKISQRADLGDVRGAWQESVDCVNDLISDLVHPTFETSRVIGAVANGDLSQMMALEGDGRPLQGEFLKTATTVNAMVDQLGSFASEVTRVAREVGTEGKLGGQAVVKGVAGTWKDLTDNVNLMAANLTGQVRNIAEVTTAVANGDLTKKIAVDVKGEFFELKATINTMVDQLRSFASEVTRVAREVGTEGKLGGQASVKGGAGTWKDLTDSVNSMAGNLTAQVRNIAEVTTAVAKGDLSRKITVDVRGEILELKNTINTMVDQLRSFGSEVTRVAREVGTEGKLGGQADVQGVAGTWKDLTDSVNSMAGNLTGQVRNIAAVTTAVAHGDLSKKITVDVKGEILELKDTTNTMVDQLRSFASEVTRVAREVGTDGKLGGQADVPEVAGTWKDLTDSVNFMAGNLTAQVRNIAHVTKAVARGDLSKKVTVDVKGEILELKDTVNTMVDQLSSFAAEVTRVAHEVGTEGNLGGQAHVQGVSGVWKDLTDNVNFMASNLTSQVRGIARVVTAVAGGALNRKLTVEAKGEIAALSDTINGMIDTLATFADQVTTVAREVGVEGKLGGQASVPGAAGTWKALTDNVNQLAQNLTTQVRAIAEVATAVTKGDLTRSITVEALGEVAALKDNINEMIRNLKDTTLKNSEQNWLKTNLAKFSRMLQGEHDLLTVGRMILSEVAPVVAAQQGVLYTLHKSAAGSQLKLLASYGHMAHDTLRPALALGEGLIGQCAIEKQSILLSNVPKDYIRISSGLGDGTPATIIVLPVLFEGAVKAVLELASFERFSQTHLAFLDQLTESIGIVLNTIEANTRTEDLLKQSQSLAAELQAQQEELRQTNQQLGEKAELLADQNVEVERKNREVEQARKDLEEKAKQLALTSKFKSEFLANMSHELRTPLNSLLILSELLARNQGANLTDKQIQFSKTIHASGNDLLNLINDILDLSKIESGTVVVDIEELQLHDLLEYVDRTFRHVAEAKKLEFTVELAENLPGIINSDSKRLQQVLKNLLSNAFKFTESGRVSLRIATATSGWSPDHEILNETPSVIVISVADTGIGIPPEKQNIIFEAFQQADGSTSRRYGGTGLGLAISRELSRLLGGDLLLTSHVNQGSTFILYLPQSLAPRAGRSVSVAPEVVLPYRHVFPLNQEADLALVNIPQLATETAVGAESLAPDAPTMLIVENDAAFSQIVCDMAREQGFRTLVTAFGASGLMLARERKPDAITLDIRLPDVDGWRVLGRLKTDVELRHIPVYVISTDEDRRRALAMGALAVLSKPVKTREALEEVFSQIKHVLQRTRQRLVVVAEEDGAATAIADGVIEPHVDVHIIRPTPEAMAEMPSGSVDCVVVRPPLWTMTLTQCLATLVERLESPDLPILIYTPEPLDAEAEAQLSKASHTLTIKRVMSPERLMDETALFLHWPFVQLSPTKQQILRTLYEDDDILRGRTVLIVDDDIRNIFAMTSVLEQHAMNVLSAESGHQAIEQLTQNANVEIVLMDIMMPDMDGFDTMRAIRRIPRFKSLPIVAVTAKAMKGDRERCMEAGAWDYLSKPVDPLQMVSSCRAWLHR